VMNDERGLLRRSFKFYHHSSFIIHHCFSLPCLIRDGEKREAGKQGSWEKVEALRAELNACGDTEGNREDEKRRIVILKREQTKFKRN